MKILAIETSCDETSAAVVEDGVRVLSCEIFSQALMHAKTGGVVPEVAAREHVLKIVPVIEKSLRAAGIGRAEIDAIAVTRGPGLLSSLVVGFAAAQTLAMLWKKPLIPVHHVAGHIYANWLEGDEALTPALSPRHGGAGQREREINFPVLVLTVSGGHNELVLMCDHCQFELIGETLDDSAGEAFDKVARVLGLGYPGGPAIARAALQGDATKFKLPRAMLKSKDFNFSFSGLKTAVLNIVEKERSRVQPGMTDEKFKADLAASFEECVAEILATKLINAAKKLDVKEVHLAGGVSANLVLRKKVEEMLVRDSGPGAEMKLRYNQTILYCTDNAAMIAAAGYFYYKNNSNRKNSKERYNNLGVDQLPDPNLSLYEK